MTTNKKLFPKWESKSAVSMQAGRVEYKYVMLNDNGEAEWEKGDNRVIDLGPFVGRTVVVEDDGWNQKSRAAKVWPVGGSEPSKVMEVDGPPAHKETTYNSNIQPKTLQMPKLDGNSSGEARKFLKNLLDANASSVTWKSKLETVNRLIEQNKAGSDFASFHTEGLAILAAYLYFINSGQITCGDQGHFRPNHSAGFSYNMYKVLDSECLVRGSESGSSNAHIIRLLKTQLPSFAD